MGPQDLLDALDEIVYVSDPNTYELLYANRRCRSLLPTRDYKGKPCYALLQGQPAPLSLLHQCPAHTGQILRLGIQQPFHGAAFSFERQTD